MIIGGGAIDAMIKSFKNNRNLLGKRKKLKDLYAERRFDHYQKKEFKYIKADPVILKKIHEKIIRDNHLSLVKRVVLFLITTLVFGGIFFYFLFLK